LETRVTNRILDEQALSAAAQGSTRSERETWNFAHFLSAHLASLETRAAILIPAQVSALIAIWTQLYTFEETVPHTLVWIAWAVLILGLVGAAWLITPGKLHRTSIVAYGLHARPGVDDDQVVQELCANVHERVRLLHVGLRVSIGLTVLSLGLVVLAYALDKGLFDG
jgi:hypothetical protein